jgi:hypothetical protein
VSSHVKDEFVAVRESLWANCTFKGSGTSGRMTSAVNLNRVRGLDVSGRERLFTEGAVVGLEELREGEALGRVLILRLVHFAFLTFVRVRPIVLFWSLILIFISLETPILTPFRKS